MNFTLDSASAFLNDSVYFGAVATVLAFLFGAYLKKRFNCIFFNPILVSIIIVAFVLKVFKVDFANYDEGAKIINYLLTPATICLAIPLYKQFELLKRNWKVVLVAICAGVVVNCAFVYFVAKLFQLEHNVYATFIVKSITTAIGMGVTAEIGGDVTLAVVAIILSGITGAVLGEKTLRLFGITNPTAQGLAIGTASHAIGTSKALEMGETQGAASGLAVVVTGLLTVALAPIVAGFI